MIAIAVYHPWFSLIVPPALDEAESITCALGHDHTTGNAVFLQVHAEMALLYPSTLRVEVLEFWISQRHWKVTVDDSLEEHDLPLQWQNWQNPQKAIAVMPALLLPFEINQQCPVYTLSVWEYRNTTGPDDRKLLVLDRRFVMENRCDVVEVNLQVERTIPVLECWNAVWGYFLSLEPYKVQLVMVSHGISCLRHLIFDHRINRRVGLHWLMNAFFGPVYEIASFPKTETSGDNTLNAA